MEDILFDYISRYITLTEAEKNAITAFDIFRSEKKGAILLEEGQYSKESFFVLKGCIRTYYVVDGEEKTTAFFTEMEGTTAHSLISRQTSKYYISCVEDSIITVSNPDMETQVFEQFPKFETLCRMISEEIAVKKQIDFDAFKTHSPEQRYLNLLEQRPDLVQRVPQHQLASYLGITPPSLSRMRARILQKRMW